jgi:hypothetical protein
MKVAAMCKGIHLLLKFFDSGIETSYHFIFALKLPFLLFEGLNLNFFSLNFIFKIRDLIILLLSYSFDTIFLIFDDGLDGIFFLFGDSLNDVFFMGLKDIFDLREVGLDNLSHSAEVFKQRGNFLLQCCAEDIDDFRLHRSDDALNFFLVRCVLSYEGALEFHNCFNDELKLIDFGLFFIWHYFIVIEDLAYY